MFKCFINLFRLYKLFKKIKPSVVETHTSTASLLPLLAAKITGIERRIYHNHGIPFIGYEGILKWVLYILELLNCYSLVQTVWGEQNNFVKYIEYRNCYVVLLCSKLLLYSVSLKNNHPELTDF